MVAEVNVGRKVAGRRGSRGQWWQKVNTGGNREPDGTQKSAKTVALTNVPEFHTWRADLN